MMTKFSDIPNSFSFQRAKIGENCKSTKKACANAGFFCAFNDHYSSTTKFFTSQVDEAFVLLVYLKAMVTL